MPRPTRLILTGGTLTASKNAQGLLTASEDSIFALCREAGFDVSTCLQPYTIDSIDFDVGTHYAKLKQSVLSALDAGETPVVCGGTDTLAWYSTLLAQDLMRDGKLLIGSKEKIVFLSSMRSIEESQEHVCNVLEAGKLFADMEGSGAFAITAENEDTTRLAVHDVTNQFTKVSGEITNAFRSRKAAGHIVGDRFIANRDYEPPEPPLLRLEPQALARVAPPLKAEEGKQINASAMLRYMQVMQRAPQEFDALIIEGIPTHDTANTQDAISLEEHVAWLRKQGIRTIFCNPMRYNARQNTMRPAYEPPSLTPETLLRTLLDAGAEYVCEQPKDTVCRIMTETPCRRLTALRQPAHGHELGWEQTMHIRYIPDYNSMIAAIEGLAHETAQLSIAALTHGAMPNRLSSVLGTYNHSTNFSSYFEYDGTQHHQRGKPPHIEGSGTHGYAAGNYALTLVTRPPAPTSSQSR